MVCVVLHASDYPSSNLHQELDVVFAQTELGIVIDDEKEPRNEGESPVTMIVKSATGTAKEAGVIVGYRVVAVNGTTVADLGLYYGHTLNAYIAGITKRPLILKLAFPKAGLFGVLKAPVEVGVPYVLPQHVDFKFSHFYQKHVGILDDHHRSMYPVSRAHIT